MSDVVFYGASDDLVEFAGAIDEEFDLSAGFSGKLTAPDGSFLVLTAKYGGEHAEWELGIKSGSYSFPDWPIRFGDRPDYEGDPAIIIDVAEGTVIDVPGQEDD